MSYEDTQEAYRDAMRMERYSIIDLSEPEEEEKDDESEADDE